MTRVPERVEGFAGNEKLLDSILSPLAFDAPEALRSVSTWHEHIPFSFWLIEAAMPTLLVELGTYTGTSYLAFCQAVRSLGISTRCCAVDSWQAFGYSETVGDDIYKDLASYHDPRYAHFSRLLRTTFDQALEQFADGTIDILHIDGVHSYEAAKHDFESWLPKLSSRAVVLLHDTNVRENVDRLGEIGVFGAFRLWSELVGRYPRNFHLPHSYGLGVLGVGADLPDAVRNFFEVAKNSNAAALIRKVYARLGAHCSATLAQMFIKELLCDSLAAQSTPNLDGGCTAKFANFMHCVAATSERP